MKNFKEYQNKLNEHYLPLLEQYGSTFRAVDWGSHHSQMMRFQVLLEVGNFINSSVLDVGCGVGHLVNYLTDIGFKGDYLGIDALPEMITIAREYHPTRNFQESNILVQNRCNAEYVLGSGLFTFGDQEIMENTIQEMFKACHKAVAFNSLSSWTDNKEMGEFYADPLAIVEFCRTLTPWVILRHDYMPHDFTIYMYREQQKL